MIDGMQFPLVLKSLRRERDPQRGTEQLIIEVGNDYERDVTALRERLKEVEAVARELVVELAQAPPPVVQCEGEKYWSCTIGPAKPSELPDGSDAPMRDAVLVAFMHLTGHATTTIFSGWGAHLTEPQRAVVESRQPVPGKWALLARARALGLGGPA